MLESNLQSAEDEKDVFAFKHDNIFFEPPDVQYRFFGSLLDAVQKIEKKPPPTLYSDVILNVKIMPKIFLFIFSCLISLLLLIHQKSYGLFFFLAVQKRDTPKK